MAAALFAQPLELRGLVIVAAPADELGVRVLVLGRPAVLAASDRQPLLGEVGAGQVIGEVRGGEDQLAVSEGEHAVACLVVSTLTHAARPSMPLPHSSRSQGEVLTLRAAIYARSNSANRVASAR